MKIRLPGRVQGDRLLQQAQDAIHATLREVSDLEEIKGVAIRGLTLTTTSQALAHGLGRRPIGWRLIDKTTSGDAYRTAWDDRTISLRAASGTLSCDVWVW